MSSSPPQARLRLRCRNHLTKAAPVQQGMGAVDQSCDLQCTRPCNTPYHCLWHMTMQSHCLCLDLYLIVLAQRRDVRMLLLPQASLG